MRRHDLMCLLAVCLLVVCGSCSRKADEPAQQAPVNQPEEPQALQEDTDPKAWYADAGLGMFLHWGISAAHPEGAIEISWSMVKDWIDSEKATMTPNEYFKLAEVFDPQEYNPDKWCKEAAEAGFTYAVLTTRHHDGYALWPSEYGEFSTKQYMNGRDLVGEYVAACRKYGLKVGLYYSPPDWYFNREYMSFRLGTKGFDLWAETQPDAAPLGVNHEEIELKQMPPEHIQAFKDYMKGQVTELLTNWGTIDLLWFDYNFKGHVGITMDEVRAISPNTVVNHRLHGKGDFLTFEGDFPKEDPANTGYPAYEVCVVMNPGWAHRKDESTKDIGIFTEWFVKSRSMGCNFLPNFAPRPDGRLPESVYERMGELTAWMAHSRESVFDIKGAYWRELAQYPVTMSKDESVWYVHFLPGDKEPAVLKDTREPKAVTLLRTGEPVEYEVTADGVKLTLDEAMKTKAVDVVKVVW